MRTAGHANQYQTRPETATAGQPALPLLHQTADPPTHMKCNEVWGGVCIARVEPPHWSHVSAWTHNTHPTVHMRRTLAGYLGISPEMLEYLAKDLEVEVRLEVAKNYACPTAVQEQLARDGHNGVRRMVAWNHNCPPAAMEHLAIDSDLFVRRELASNPVCSPDVLERLAGDLDQYVRQMVALRTSNPALLERLILDRRVIVRQAAADNPNLPQAAFAMWQLAHDHT